MKHSGTADLPLHYGTVPAWLAARMARLGLAITESILTEYGQAELSDFDSESWRYGGRTVFGEAKAPQKKNIQLNLF